MPLRPTFATALNSTLPQAVGKCANNRTEVAAYVNEAIERLMMDPLTPDEGFWGGSASMLFNLTISNYAAYVRTPREVARIIVTDICQRPRPLRNGFYEYLSFGVGYQPKPCGSNCCATTQGFDRDNVTTLVPFPTTVPQYIRVYPTDAADVGSRVIIQGLDQNGNPVLSTDPVTGLGATGEVIYLAQPFSTSLFAYQNNTGILKQPTNGPVQFSTVDPTTLAEVTLSSMEPNEVTASYRQYLLNGLPTHCCNSATGTVQVQAQCRLDFIPVINDTDYLLIQSIPALIEEVQAIRYSRMDNQAAAALEQKHHTKALSILTGQLDMYLGKVRTAIGVPIWGSDRLTRMPV